MTSSFGLRKGTIGDEVNHDVSRHTDCTKFNNAIVDGSGNDSRATNNGLSRDLAKKHGALKLSRYLGILCRVTLVHYRCYRLSVG